MLILTRRIGEKIIIGDDIVITVLSNTDNNKTYGSGTVRLGIKAPKDLPVHREEIYIKINSKKPVDSDNDQLEYETTVTQEGYQQDNYNK